MFIAEERDEQLMVSFNLKLAPEEVVGEFLTIPCYRQRLLLYLRVKSLSLC